jgi:hypothetical protein
MGFEGFYFHLEFTCISIITLAPPFFLTPGHLCFVTFVYFTILAFSTFSDSLLESTSASIETAVDFMPFSCPVVFPAFCFIVLGLLGIVFYAFLFVGNFFINWQGLDHGTNVFFSLPVI